MLFEVNREELGEQVWLVVVEAEFFYFVETALVYVLLDGFFVFFLLDEEEDVLVCHPGVRTDLAFQLLNTDKN